MGANVMSGEGSFLLHLIYIHGLSSAFTFHLDGEMHQVGIYKTGCINDSQPIFSFSSLKHLYSTLFFRYIVTVIVIPLHYYIYCVYIYLVFSLLKQSILMRHLYMYKSMHGQASQTIMW